MNGNNVYNTQDGYGTHYVNASGTYTVYITSSSSSTYNDFTGEVWELTAYPPNSTSAGTQLDFDDDNDGTNDTEDAFPLDANESLDTDGDGIGNNADADDDGDGVTDANDAFPLDPNEDTDSDGDGVGDNSDLCSNTASGASVDQFGCGPTQRDSDNDGYNDAIDAFPNDAMGMAGHGR